MLQPGPGSSSSSSLSRSLETAQATIKKLKSQIDNLERENRDLKRTVYDLNFEQARLIASLRQPLPPYDITQALSAAAETERDRQSADPPDPFSAKPCRLVCRSTLKGHGGAVYDIAWSPSGSVLASGSFDGACRLWDVEASRLVRPHEPVVLRDSQRNVSCLAWISAGALVSASYDGSAVVWDTTTRTVTMSVANVPGGAVLSVASAAPTTTTFFAATSQGVISGYDTRSGTRPVCVMANGAMVSTVACLPDGKEIVSGDHGGQVRTWSLATGQYGAGTVVVVGAPISHVTVNGDLLAVNSFDNVLRLYDRPSMALAYELVGHRNRNWPIRSSIYVDHDQSEDSTEDEQVAGGHGMHRFLIASGSADSGVYLFDLGATRQQHPAQTRLSGKHLDGHRDRVYSVAFHRDKLVLASCSADGTVKIWK